MASTVKLEVDAPAMFNSKYAVFAVLNTARMSVVPSIKIQWILFPPLSVHVPSLAIMSFAAEEYATAI